MTVENGSTPGLQYFWSAWQGDNSYERGSSCRPVLLQLSNPDFLVLVDLDHLSVLNDQRNRSKTYFA